MDVAPPPSRHIRANATETPKSITSIPRNHFISSLSTPRLPPFPFHTKKPCYQCHHHPVDPLFPEANNPLSQGSTDPGDNVQQPGSNPTAVPIENRGGSRPRGNLSQTGSPPPMTRTGSYTSPRLPPQTDERLVPPEGKAIFLYKKGSSSGIPDEQGRSRSAMLYAGWL